MIERNFSFFETRKLARELKKRDKRLKALIGGETAYEKQAILLAKDAENEQIVNQLMSTSVDELSKARLGIRITALKDAGYTNIWQLRGKNTYQLQSIEGIGPKSAANIVIQTRNIIQSVTDNVHLNIDCNAPTATTDKLVKSLYQAQQAKRISNEAERLYSQTHDELKSSLKSTMPARSWLVWQLTSDEKKAFVIESLVGLKEFAEDTYKANTDELLSQEYSLKKVEHREYWGSFTRNSAGFYAVLERAKHKATRSNNRLNDIQYTAVRNGLPEELAIAISKVPLNLSGLNANLYSYQEYGVQYILNQGAVLLGDEMGLGKTVQAIAAMVSLKNNGATHFLVVCPASVIINWCREIRKFSDLEAIKIHGKKIEEDEARWLKFGGIAVTTYETLSKVSIPADFRYDMLVVDEAHYVKNPKASRTMQLLFFRQHTDRVLFMTGTPLENRVSEMCFLIGCLQPDVAKTVSGSTSLSMASDFRRKVSGVYFRRTKEDVLSELPDKIEKEEWIELNPGEIQNYKSYIEEENFMKLRQVSWLAEDGEESSKFSRLKELIEEYIEDGKKIIVFSFFVNTISYIMRELPGDVYGPITGAVSPIRRQEIIDQFTDIEGGAVLLSQIQAGGTGLNIQAASVIIFCEPQLKPSIEEQAIARAYRMGQNNTVMVHRLLNDNTVDEQIMVLLKEKRELFDAFADISESGLESLSDSAIAKRIMAEEKKRYCS